MSSYKKLLYPLLICLFCTQVHAQANKIETTLSNGQSVEREIAGGELHTYQIALTAGQFAQFRLEQHAIDAALSLTAPDGKPLAELNLSDSGNPEIFSLEVAQPGKYLITVTGSGHPLFRGSYGLSVVVQPTATEKDRKYIAAQTLLVDAYLLFKQFPQTEPQAMEKLEQALNLWRELGMPYESALTLHTWGKGLIRLNQNEKSIPLLEQARTIYQTTNNRYGEAGVLNVMANVYFNTRNYPKAIEVFDEALRIYREVKDRRWEGIILGSLGNNYPYLNQPEKAIEYYDQSLPILREVKERRFEAQILRGLGTLYLNRGQMDKALEKTEASVKIFQELKDRSQEGNSLSNIGIIYSRLGQSDKAIAVFDQILAIFREIKDGAQEANTLVGLGMAFGGAGQTEKAIDYFEQGLLLSREVKNSQLEAITLGNLGLAYQLISEYEKALEKLGQALKIAQATKNRRGEANAFNTMGAAQSSLSRYEKAIDSHEQALAIFREIKYRLGEGNTLENLGKVYRFLGREDKAIEYYNQAITIFRETKYPQGEGNILGLLGNVYERQGRHDEANQAQEQAIAIFRELKYPLGEGNVLLDQGIAKANQNQPEQALTSYEQALAIFRETKERSFEATALLKIGEAKQKLGQTDAAAGLFAESLKVVRAIGSRTLEVEPLTAAAKLEMQRGNFAQARAFIENSLQVGESLRADLISAESRTAFLATIQGTYQVYTELLMRQHQSEPLKGFNALGLEVSERQRARSLLDLLAESRTNLRQDIDQALVSRERTLARQLSTKAQQLAPATKAAQMAVLKLEISQLEIDIERAQADIRKASPHYAALTQPQPLKLNEMQRQLDENTLLLEYALGPERSYVWAITKDSLTSYELPKAEITEKSARQVYELLQARATVKPRETVAQQRQRIAQADTQLTAAAQELSNLVLAPVAAQLGDKRLVIVADGALQYVPFAMLPNPQSAEPLIVKHEIVSLPSASALAIQRNELAGRPLAPKLLAVIADPVFDRTDVRLSGVPATNEVEAATRSLDDQRSIVHLAEKTAAASNGTTRKFVIPRLPYTRQEAKRLLTLAPQDATFGALDFQANRAAALNPALGQYRYVHFATHGVLDSERPGLSSLLLSMVDEKGKPQDGFLRANDIYNMKLPAELVVLSACQTGLGKEIKGEGLVGLTRGFMYAGAARVIVSLWNVNDQATAELMTRLYQKMLKQGERPAAALRAAQVELWKQKQWKAPFYWAAFTLQGEWK